MTTLIDDLTGKPKEDETGKELTEENIKKFRSVSSRLKRVREMLKLGKGVDEIVNETGVKPRAVNIQGGIMFNAGELTREQGIALGLNKAKNSDVARKIVEQIITDTGAKPGSTVQLSGAKATLQEELNEKETELNDLIKLIQNNGIPNTQPNIIKHNMESPNDLASTANELMNVAMKMRLQKQIMKLAFKDNEEDENVGSKRNNSEVLEKLARLEEKMFKNEEADKLKQLEDRIDKKFTDILDRINHKTQPSGKDVEYKRMVREITALRERFGDVKNDNLKAELMGKLDTLQNNMRGAMQPAQPPIDPLALAQFGLTSKNQGEENVIRLMGLLSPPPPDRAAEVEMVKAKNEHERDMKKMELGKEPGIVEKIVTPENIDAATKLVQAALSGKTQAQPTNDDAVRKTREERISINQYVEHGDLTFGGLKLDVNTGVPSVNGKEISGDEATKLYNAGMAELNKRATAGGVSETAT